MKHVNKHSLSLSYNEDTHATKNIATTYVVDVVITVVLPLLAGTLLYSYSHHHYLPSIIRNYIPDACWAFAFMSVICIIWQRNPPTYWVTITCISAVSYELAQYFALVSGYADVIDLVVYVLAFAYAYYLNQSLKKKYIQPIKTPLYEP
jgi:hypothetical protein